MATHRKTQKAKTEAVDNARKYANEYNTSFLSRTAEQVLYEGLPIQYAAEIFHISDTDLKKLVDMKGVQPIGTFGKAQLYSIYDLANVCVSPDWTDDEWEKMLSKRHFPAQLVKDFWVAKKARQDYLLSAGDLWHTTEVIGALSEAFKTVAMGIKLITDQVERETTLTVHQRNLINEFIDSALQGGAKQLQDVFEKRVYAEKIVRYEDLTGEFINDRNENDTATTDGETEGNTYDLADL